MNTQHLFFFVFLYLLSSHMFSQLSAELKQVQTKLVQMEQKVTGQAAECEHQQQKIRQLELELARSSANRNATTSLQGDLQAERARLIAADKKVSITVKALVRCEIWIAWFVSVSTVIKGSKWFYSTVMLVLL